MSDDRRLGAVGDGFSIAMGTLDTFPPPSARRRAAPGAPGSTSLFEPSGARREQFGKTIADIRTVQGYLAEMATTSTPRGCWCFARRTGRRIADRPRGLRRRACARCSPPEAAQRVIDQRRANPWRRWRGARGGGAAVPGRSGAAHLEAPRSSTAGDRGPSCQGAKGSAGW